MATQNMYAPPGAMVGDVVGDAVVQPIRFWPPSGRIGRVRMLAYSMALYFIFVIGIFVAIMVTGFSANKGGSGAFGMILLGLLYIAYAVAGTCVMIQRSHDMDLSGWSVLLLLIPFVVFYWLFKSGTPGNNRFGAPPPPNSTGVLVLAWLALGIPFLVGILAAIALPAYQDYVKRTQAETVQSPAP